MEPSNTAERNDSLLQELRTYVICTPDVMYKMTIIVSNRKTSLFMQSVIGWQNFSAQTHRLEHQCGTNALPHMPDSGSNVRLVMVANFFTPVVWKKRST